MFEGDGYEGLAIAVMTAAVQRRKVPLIVNVPNRGAIPGLRDDDVVEVTCQVDEHGHTRWHRAQCRPQPAR